MGWYFLTIDFKPELNIKNVQKIDWDEFVSVVFGCLRFFSWIEHLCNFMCNCKINSIYDYWSIADYNVF